MGKGIRAIGRPINGARIYARKGRYPELRLPNTVKKVELHSWVGIKDTPGRYLDIDNFPEHLKVAIEKGFWTTGPLTRKRGSIYKNEIQRYIRELFGAKYGLQAWVRSVINKTGSITAEAIAAETLARVYAASNYNNYTGNLSGAFYAAIVRGRKVVGKFEINEEDGGFKSGQYTINDNGRKIAYLQEPPRHTHSIKKIGKANRYREGKSARRYRYIKKWERLEGYKGMTILQKRGGAFGYMTEQGRGTTQSGIIIGNTAPYSNKLGKKYTVLKGAKVRGEVNGKWNKETRNIYRSIGKADIDYLYKLFGAKNVKW